MSDAVDKIEDTALSGMNETLRRMHKTPPTPHKAKGEGSADKNAVMDRAARKRASAKIALPPA